MSGTFLIFELGAAMDYERRGVLRETLLGFSEFNRQDVKPSIQNCLLLLDTIPAGMTNGPLIFMFDRAIAYTSVMFCLQLHEVWIILNQELKILGETQVSGGDFESLDRIRDKLIGHKIVNSQSFKHTDWFIRNFGSHRDIFKLIHRISDALENKIEHLHKRGALTSGVSIAVTPRDQLKEQEIKNLVVALKERGIF